MNKDPTIVEEKKVKVVNRAQAQVDPRQDKND
jgi:hypothetical protein